jgi:HEAT repeats
MTLADDVARLLAAGSQQAVGDDGLCRRSQSLRQLGKQVAALNPIADAIDKVLSANTKQAAPALLDLVVLTRQVKAGLATAGQNGEMRPLRNGAWATHSSARDVQVAFDLLEGSDRESNRLQRLREAFARHTLADLRLVQPLLRALGDGHAPVADFVATEVLPTLGPSLLPFVEEGFNLQGKALDARRLLAICHIDKARGKELCLKGVEEGSLAVKVQALECLGLVDPSAAESVAMKSIADPKGEVRAAACVALMAVPKDQVLDAMIGLVDDTREVWDSAERALARFVHPGATNRLIAELEQADDAWANVSAQPQQKKAAKGSAKAAKNPTKPAKSAEDKERERWQGRMQRILGALGRRADCRVAVPMLTKLAKHPAAELRTQAFQVLGDTIGGESEAVVRLLIDGVNDKALGVGGAAIRGLGSAAAKSKAAVRELTRLADDDKSKKELRIAAVAALTDAARSDSSALDCLGRCLKSDVEWLKMQALSSAQLLESTAAPLLPSLVDMLPFAKNYYGIHYTFTRIDPRGRQALPLLMKLAKDRKRKTEARESALSIVAQYRDANKLVVNDLASILTDSKDPVLPSALLILKGMGTEAAPALPRLFELVKRGHDLGGLTMIFASLDPFGTTAMPALADLIQDSNKETRITAVRALGRFESRAAAFRADIEKLAAGKDKALANAATEALRAISE